MTDSPVDPRDFRVSDSEREHVIGLLQKAIGQGLITLDEFSTRTDTALAARTRSELNAVLVDLPGMVHKEAAPPPGVPTAKPKVELRSTMSKLRRTGRWVVPRELVVRIKAGAADLDFTEAKIEHPVVSIELDVTAGPVRLLLPEDASVDIDELQLAAGKLENKVHRGSGNPHFVVTGMVRAGTVTIKRATYLRIGSLVIRFPWKISTDSDQQ